MEMGWLTTTLCCTTLLCLCTTALSMKLDKEELSEIGGLIQKLVDLHKERQDKASVKKHQKELVVKHHESYENDEHDSTVNPIRHTTVKNVFGVTYLNKKIFVLPADGSNKILVFNSADMSSAGSIPISSIEHPTDIAACNVTNKLFILGRQPNSAWARVDPTSHTVEETYPLSSQSAEALSVGNGVVTMATKFTGKVIQYDGSTGVQKTAVTVNTWYQPLTPRHVIELPDGNYVSSIKNSRGASTNDQISIIDPTSGNVTGQSFGGPRGSSAHQANEPYHIAVCTGSGKVLVADFGNRRILRVDLATMSGTVAIRYFDSRGIEDGADGNPTGRPWRVWVDEVARIFIVAISAGQVYVYNLSDVGC